jgi:hypothetical protein
MNGFLLSTYNLAERASLEEAEPIFTYKRLSFRKHSFQNLSRLLQGNNMLHAPASNMHAFLWRDTCVYSTLLSIPSWRQTELIFKVKHLSCRKDCFQKLTEFSQGKNVLDAPASTRDGFLCRDTCVSSSQLKRPIWNEMCHCLPENCHFQEELIAKTNSILSWEQCGICSCF